MTNQELQNKLNRLQRAICCNKPKTVDELPEGNSGNGFVIFEGDLYFWDGDSWEAVGGGGGGSVWGTITGTLSDQLDLQAELDDKQDTLVSGTTIKTINSTSLLGSGNIVAGGTGLEALDEGNGIGWRLVSRDPAKFGDIGLGAIDFSFSPYSSSTKGATGEYSFSSGYNTTASGNTSNAWGSNTQATGNRSTVWGLNTISSGTNSTSWGRYTTASGANSTAFGQYSSATAYNSTAWGNTTQATQPNATAWGFSSIASGGYSTSFGYSTTASSQNATAFGERSIASATNATAFGTSNTANSFASTVLGNYSTIASSQNTSTFVSTDELFKIGNGIYGSRSNALKIYKNAVQVQGGITAAAASALTPEAGMLAYVTTTDVTFVTTGFWKYQGGAWTPF